MFSRSNGLRPRSSTIIQPLIETVTQSSGFASKCRLNEVLSEDSSEKLGYSGTWFLKVVKNNVRVIPKILQI